MKLIITFFIFSTLYLFAQSHPNSVGIGYIYSQNVYKNDNDTKIYIPIINFQYENLYIRGVETGYNFNNYLTAILQPRFNNHSISGMDSRYFSLDIGLKLQYKVERFKFELKTVHDTLSIYNGFETSFKISRPLLYYPIIFIPFAGVEYQSKKLVDYYYGVKNGEIFEEYSPDYSFNRFMGFVSIYNFLDDYAISMIYKYTDFGEDISNSPIIDKGYRNTFILSLVYKY